MGDEERAIDYRRSVRGVKDERRTRLRRASTCPPSADRTSNKIIQLYIIDIDFSGMGQATGKEADPVDLAEVHLAVVRCPSDLFQADGDSVPALG